ncbi:MAG: ATP-binding cassette domain-containing protein [Candidatus Hadarchaeia archaeon]
MFQESTEQVASDENVDHGSSGEFLSIDARNIGLTYGDGTEALKNVSLEVPRGEFFGFLGPNGAGKTTFIKILVTLLRPTEGGVWVNGFNLKENSQAVRETIGYMDQETRVDEELSARDNIQFACEAYGVPREKREERIKKLLELVELTDVADKKADDFSGGMKKRLDVATALVHEPPLIFLDEPTTGLDPKSRERLWKYFERINSEGRTIFLTTQYLEEADRLCDRIAVIQNGKIIATDSPGKLKQRVGGYVLEIRIEGVDEIKERAANIVREANIFDEGVNVDITEEGINVASNQIQDKGTDLLVKLKNSDIPIIGFNLHEPTLDDVFLTITGEHAEKTERLDSDKELVSGERK